MDIRFSQETVTYWQKKGALSVCFGVDEKDGVLFERSGRHTLSLRTVAAEKMTRRTLILLVRRIIREALAKKEATIVLDIRQFRFPNIRISDADLAELITVNCLMAEFSFRDFLSVPKEGFGEVRTVVLLGAFGREMRLGIRRGIVIGEETNRSRRIATMPGGEMTPERLAAHAKDALRGLPVSISVLDESSMRRLKMGGVLGVGQGSASKPRFIILEYFGAAQKKEQPIVLVGKGVTFDTGGINLKPDDAMLGMNMDMSGGAAVIHTIAAAARLRIPKNIVTLVPAVENMPSGSSYRPGDILRSMSGKTIEVRNTDAEGRIILADALHYAKRYKPALVIDVATLTGAALVALGERAIALFTADETLEAMFRTAGEESGDYVWPLPLWEEYDQEIKGTFGDIANIGKTRFGGAITAAVFLKQFVDDAYRFVHLDIAPRMTALPDEFLAAGSAGTPIRLLLKVLERV